MSIKKTAVAMFVLLFLCGTASASDIFEYRERTYDVATLHPGEIRTYVVRPESESYFKIGFRADFPMDVELSVSHEDLPGAKVLWKKEAVKMAYENVRVPKLYVEEAATPNHVNMNVNAGYYVVSNMEEDEIVYENFHRRENAMKWKYSLSVRQAASTSRKHPDRLIVFDVEIDWKPWSVKNR